MKNLLLTMLAVVFCSASFAQLNCSTVNASISLSASGGVVTLTNNSTPTGTSNIRTYYNVNWGDNQTSWAQNNNALTHTYHTSGTYSVRLISTVIDSLNNITCTDTANANISVTTSLNCNNINAAMQAYVSSGNIGNVTRSNTLQGYPGLGVQYIINWGDGNTSGANYGNNTHTYNTAGSYLVKYYMIVTDSGNNITCYDSASATLNITTSGGLNCNNVNAAFSRTISGMNVTAVNNSTPNPGSGISATYVYNWGDGSTTNKTNKTNTTHTYTSNGNYTITLHATYTAGSTTCTDSTSQTVSINVTPPNKITGIVYLDSLNLGQNDSIKIWLITFDSSTNILTAVDSQMRHASWGYYSFNNKASGQYRTKAKLINGQTSGFGHIPTYHDSSLLWSTATIINHNGGTTSGKNIYLKKGTVTSGLGFIGGSVLQGANKGTANGIAGMNILLTDATDNIITYAVTDANGEYEFKDLPIATYKVHPEDIGYNTTHATVLLTTGSYTVNGMNFERSLSNKTIKPKTSGISEINGQGLMFKVYPNPATDVVSINWDTNSNETANITITDISGKTVYNAEQKMSADTQINVAHLQAGLYFLTIEAEYGNNTQKLIIK